MRLGGQSDLGFSHGQRGRLDKRQNSPKTASPKSPSIPAANTPQASQSETHPDQAESSTHQSQPPHPPSQQQQHPHQQQQQQQFAFQRSPFSSQRRRNPDQQQQQQQQQQQVQHDAQIGGPQEQRAVTQRLLGRTSSPRAPASRLWNPQNFSPRSFIFTDQAEHPSQPAAGASTTAGAASTVTSARPSGELTGLGVRVGAGAAVLPLAGPATTTSDDEDDLHHVHAAAAAAAATATATATVSYSSHSGARDEQSLLTPPEQHRSRQDLHQASSSIRVESESVGVQSGSASTSVGLSSRKRKALSSGSAVSASVAEGASVIGTVAPPRSRLNIMVAHDGASGRPGPDNDPSPLPVDSGMLKDIEVGTHQSLRRSPSRVSIPLSQHGDLPGNQLDGAGRDGEAEDDEFEWGPSHPCYPHLNPHVSILSPQYESTRIIRIRRDWMQVGDMAPTFANLYPEVLDPILPEEEFRRVLKHVNEELVAAFNPYAIKSWIDSFLGLVTAWAWEDLGLTAVHRRLKRLANWLETWNRNVGEPEGVRIIPLRNTAFMTLDIEIPDPQISVDISRPVTRQTDVIIPYDLTHHAHLAPPATA